MTDQRQMTQDIEDMRIGKPEEQGTLTIKYNGEFLEIPMEEAVILAQKGMNYDRMLERLERLEKAPEMELLNTFAKKMGMEREALVRALIQESAMGGEQKAENEEIPAPDPAEGFIEERPEAGLENQQEPPAREMPEEQPEQTEKSELEDLQERLAAYLEKEKRLKLWAEFFRKHPEISGFDALDQEVKEAVAAGEAPEAAYMLFENRMLKEQLRELSGKGGARNPGRMQSDAKGDGLDTFQRAMMEALRG